MLSLLVNSILLFQTPPGNIQTSEPLFTQVQGLPVIECPSNTISIPVAFPPGTTKSTVVKLVCIPVNPELFGIEEGLITLRFTMTLTPQYSLAGLKGPFDSGKTLYTFNPLPAAGTGIAIFKNGVMLANRVDYKINGNFVVFIGRGVFTSNDVVKVYFQNY